MTIPNEHLSVTRPMPEPMSVCPDCDQPGLVRKTRDANSLFLGDVYCPSCQWVRTRSEYMSQIWPGIKGQ